MDFVPGNMTKRFKFGRLMLAAISFIAVSGIAASSAFAQKPQTHPDRPPQRQQSAAPPRANTNRPPANSQAARPIVDRMRDLTPQQRDRVLQSSRSFENLSPEQQGRIRQQFNQWDRMTPMQRADLREKENAWRNLTPEQREHIKRDVLPTWRQL